MNWVEQIVSAVEVSAKSAWRVFLATAAVLIAVHYFPQHFIDLPLWIPPTLRIVTIISGTLVMSYLINGVSKRSSSLIQKSVSRLSLPSKRQKLETANIHEVCVLCAALAKEDREIRLNPDLPVTLSLLEKGVIETYWSGVIYGDGLSNFRIPLHVWKLLLSMEEFEISNKSAFIAATQGNSETKIRSVLPQKHPAVIELREQENDD